MAHTRSHGLVDTDNHEPGTDNTVLGTAGGALIEKAFGITAAGNTLVERQASGNITLPATDPVAQTDAASKGYVDAKVATGVTWKELILACEQLVNGDPGGGIAQGILLAIAVNLQAGDTITISDGTTTETFTAVAGAPAANQFQVGASAAVTTTNLVAAINADSALWSAVETDGLDAYLVGAVDPQLVIYRSVPVADEPDRVFGTIANAQSDVRVVAFNGIVQDYRESSGSETDLPAADPAAKRFGFGRLAAAVQTGDTHRCANDNNAFTWDGDDDLWQNTDTGTTVTPGDGIDITGGKIATKTATPAGAATQQFGGIVNNRTSDGTGAAAADQGYLALKTDNNFLAIDQALNQLTLIGVLGQFQGAGSWTSTSPSDKEPTLAEYQAFLGNTAADIGNWGFLIESGGGGQTTTFLAYKKANNGVLADFHAVGLDA